MLGRLLDQERLLRDARARIDELSADYRNHTGTPTSTLLELVTGTTAVQQRNRQVQQAARIELRRLVKAPFRAPPEHLADCRTVYEHAVLDADGNEVASLLSTAEQARVLPSVPIHFYLADDRLALVLLAPDSAVILQPCGLFDAYAELFERLWECALPVHSLPAESTDAQRKIARLMQDLGAHTRFRAGRDQGPPQRIRVTVLVRDRGRGCCRDRRCHEEGRARLAVVGRRPAGSSLVRRGGRHVRRPRGPVRWR